MSDNWQLGIESSTALASVALCRGGEVVAEASVGGERNPSEVLMDPLREVLEALPTRERLEVAVIGAGPGSYNGSRVGIALAQGVALVHKCPAVGICSLEAVPAVRSGAQCLAVGDARRGTFFTLPLEEGRLSGSVDLLDHEEFVSRVESAEAALISFEATERLRLPAGVTARVTVVTPQARLLVEAWRLKSPNEQGRLLGIPPEPFYLREPYVTTAGKGG